MISRLLRLVPDPYPQRKRISRAILEPVEWLTSEPSYEDERHSTSQLSINLAEHWGIVGATGSGKTYFTVKGLLAHLKRVAPHAPRIVIDSTHDQDLLSLLDDAKVIYGNEPPALVELSRRHTLVWQTKNSKIPGQYALFFQRLNDLRQPFILVIDEIKSITGKAAEELEALLSQVRKHGGTVIILTQSIAGVEPEIFRQMSHFAQFFINSEVYDMSRSRAYLNLAKGQYHPPLHEHGFWYRRTRGNFPAEEYRDMQEFFKVA